MKNRISESTTAPPKSGCASSRQQNKAVMANGGMMPLLNVFTSSCFVLMK